MIQRARACIITPVLSLESLQNHRAALVIAHPGHELRVYRWASWARPRVFVFTDGSGHSGQSRLHRTTSILQKLGGQPGSIYGRLSDAEIYSAILNRDAALFCKMADELAEELVCHQIHYVVGDAFEGYNPAHDVCRLVINAAIRIASLTFPGIENFEVLLANKGYDHPPSNMVRIELEEEMLAQKIGDLRAYSELAADADRILADEGVDSLRTEYLRRVVIETNDGFKEPPFYETYGEDRVAAGYYKQVIRYRDHVLPIAEALRRSADRRRSSR